MDDGQFDDSIKRKVGEHEYSGFDPAALAALHRQMAASTVSPWYEHYASPIWTGLGFLLSTVIIVTALWYKDNESTNQLDEKIISLAGQTEQIAKLQVEIELLKSTNLDTIKMVEIREYCT